MRPFRFERASGIEEIMRRLSSLFGQASARPRFGFRAGVSVSLVALVLAACAGKSEPRRGQITLALQSDMSLPKDVDSIRIQILVQGRPHFDSSYVVGTRRTDAKMPATLAIVAGDDPSVPVEIRVLAFRNNGSEVRTLNKTITTIPESRNAILRVPIQWLCEGQVTRVDNDTFQTKCESDDDGDETSCVAGRCEKVEVDEDDLPEFAAQKVFGGSDGTTQGDGQCFPTEVCFDDAEQAFDVTPNLADCTVDMAVPDDGQPNFAILVPEDGICSGVRCYVPLDKNDEDENEATGWSEIDGAEGNLQRFQLPPGVCDRIADGRAFGVRASTGCETKTSSRPPCGPWSSVGDPMTEPIPPPPDDTCQNFVPGQNVGSPTPDPMLNAYLQATADTSAYAEQAKAQLANACATMARALGNAVEIGNPPSDADLSTACNQAASALTGAPERAEFSLLGGYCRANVASQTVCEASCPTAATSTPEERCTSPSGVCAGDCGGTCFTTPNSPVACAGTCEGVCDGECVGECLGTFAAASSSSCGGTCVGTCNGLCAGACGTLADGICSGRCEIPQDSDAACAGGWDTPPECALPLAADDTIDPVCAAVCTANAASTPGEEGDPVMQVVNCTFEVPALSSQASAAASMLAPAIRLGQEALGKAALLAPVADALEGVTATLEQQAGGEPYSTVCVNQSTQMLAQTAAKLAAIEAAGNALRAALASPGSGTDCSEMRVVPAMNAMCTMAMPDADPTLVNVDFSPAVDDPLMRVPRVDNVDQCGDAPAWYYDNPTEPTTLTLCPLLCSTYQGSAGAVVELALGCATVTQ
jgi:hypothetical protein